MDDFDFHKPRQVARGTFSFFDGSMIVEFLEHDLSEATQVEQLSR